jgi:hypothetical protein
MSEYEVRRDALKDRIRVLYRQSETARFEAPNARDFPNWNAFYAAQMTHEGMMAAQQREIDSLTNEVFVLDDIIRKEAS